MYSQLNSNSVEQSCGDSLQNDNEIAVDNNEYDTEIVN